MALQSSGQISFSNISTEFGASPNSTLGGYRISQTVGTLSNLPLDDGIPQSGSIKFSDFYGKRLNIVVDLYNPALNNLTRLNARTRYDQNAVTVIGGFKSKPASSSGSKVFLNLNVTLGSGKDSINTVALRTGSWEQNTSLRIDIGSSGILYGAGGNGGNGAGPGSNRGGDAGPGSSALGLEYSASIFNNGTIRCGFGGGGGGGGGASDPNKSTTDFGSPGGGGGGGAGFPAGNGGAAGGGGYNTSGQQPGNNASLNAGGGGGSGASGGGSFGGAGGQGASPSNGAGNGGGGGGNLGSGGGGSAGANGYGITYNPGVSYTVSGNTPIGAQGAAGVN